MSDDRVWTEGDGEPKVTIRPDGRGKYELRYETATGFVYREWVRWFPKLRAKRWLRKRHAELAGEAYADQHEKTLRVTDL